MGRSWQAAGDIIPAVLERAGVDESFRRHMALMYWDDVVGEKIARKARPRELEGKTLLVNVESSAWVHELTYLKNDILRELNQRVGGGAIDRIVFLIGEVAEEE